MCSWVLRTFILGYNLHFGQYLNSLKQDINISQSSYSLTQRTEYPKLRLLRFAGKTLPLWKNKWYALLVLLMLMRGLGDADQ